MVINTNISAQTSARLLGESSDLLAKSLARLSSGSRLISPEDDSAGMAVSTRFDAQIHRTQAARSNASNAISFCQTQDGYLQKIGKALDRMSELAVLAQDITKTDADRSLYNEEFQTLSTYINDVATKDYNGVSLFSSGSLDVVIDSEGGTLEMAGIQADYVALSTTTHGPAPAPSSTSLGQVLSGFTGDTITLNCIYSGQPHENSFSVDSNSTVGDLVNGINTTLNNGLLGLGGQQVTASYDSSSGALSLTVADTGGTINQLSSSSLFGLLGWSGSIVTVGGVTGPTTENASLTYTPPPTTASAMDISTASGAASALDTVKSAIGQLATDRATVGATIARLNMTVDQLGTLEDNLAAANSRIKDVDVAQESTQFARYNILVQAGTAMLSQANNAPSSILRLLG